MVLAELRRKLLRLAFGSRQAHRPRMWRSAAILDAGTVPRRRRFWVLLVALALSCAFPLVAHGESSTDVDGRNWRDRALQDVSAFVRVDDGFASAVGLFGVSVGWAPSEWFEIEGGIGVGFTGLQLSLMPKLALGSLRHRFLLGGGASVGIGGEELRLDDDDRDDDASSEVLVIPWFNADVGYEYRWVTNGGVMSVMIATGLTMTLPSSAVPQLALIPQARVGIGWWF